MPSDRPASAGLGAALAAPSCIARLPGRTYVWLAVYLVLAAGVLAIAGQQILAHRGHLQQALLDYLFPSSWQFAARFVLDRFFAAQQASVLVNAAVSGSLLLTSLVLFPIKEAVSASYEVRARLTGHPLEELPLWLQGWEEVKLVLAYLAAQGVVFWVGYYPGNQWLSVALSYGLMFATFALDFLSPLFQRHRGRYSRIVKTLLRHPVASLAFGAMFAAPATLAAHLFRPGDLGDVAGLRQAVFGLFAVNLIAIAWATVAGTRLAAGMLPTFARTRASSVPVKAIAWLVLLATLGYHAYTFGAVGRAVHHKSQVLKCRYDVDWSSFGVDLPPAAALLTDEVTFGVHFSVDIENPTGFDVAVEDNRVELVHRGDVVATTRLAPFRIAAGQTVTRRVAVDVRLDPAAAGRGRALLSREAWSATLYLQVADRFELPVALLE